VTYAVILLGLPVWMARWQEGQTTRVFLRMAAMSCAHSGWDIIAAVQPRPGAPGYTIAKLPAGHYIVASPLGTPPNFAGGRVALELDVR
jgi:hypothetical protein